MELVVGFGSAAGSDASVVGGKGANLGVLTRAAFPVPAGFTVTTAAYERFLTETGLRESVQAIVAQIDFEDATNVDKRAAEIRALLESPAMPADIAEAIGGCYGELGDGTLVAVRSSGTAEDLESASFAGQHDTYLHIRGPVDVIDAVKRCWASLWTARATAYRAHKGFAQHEVGIAVVVQTMVDAEVAGVMFTANPIAGLTDEIGINASWGLGETVVSGIVTPDAFTLDKRTLVVKDRTLGAKETRIRLDDTAGAGTIHEDVPQADRDRYCLTDDQLRELGELGKKVMAHYDAIPQDTEWGLAEGTFYLLQSRPVTGTVLSWDEDLDDWQEVPDDPATVWSRAMSDDGWTGAVTPLFYTCRAHTFWDTHVFGNRMIGMPELARRRQMKYYRGTAYWSTEPDTAWVKTLAPASARPRMLANVNPFQHEEILNAPTNYLALAKVYARLQLLDRDQTATGWVKVQDDHINNRRVAAAGLSEEAISALSDEALVDYAEKRVKWEREYVIDIGLGYFLHWVAAGQALAQVVMRWYQGTNPAAILMDLLTGTESTTFTAVENLALWNMSRQIYSSPVLTELFRNNPGAGFFAKLGESNEGQEFKATYDAFLVGHGHRGHADRDIYYIRRAEDPAVDYRVFAAFLEVDPNHNPEALEEAARDRKRAAAQEITANLRAQPLGSLKAEIFRILNAYNQKLLTERDNQRGYGDIGAFAMKRAFLEIGRRISARGLFEEDRDFYFLSRYELYDVFRARANITLTKAKIAGRKHNFDLVNTKERTNPMYLRDSRPITAGNEDDGGLRGRPTSAGTATGTARLVRSLEEIGRVKQGEIMVCNSTDPGWTPVFLLLAGAVFETGGAFAHCSCISREYGIPAIQVPGALHKIPDGATITIDGNTGSITVHDTAAKAPVAAG